MVQLWATLLEEFGNDSINSFALNSIRQHIKENTAVIIKMQLKLTQFMRISLHVVKLCTLQQRLSEMNHSRRLKM
ncbi:hypothetical protein MHYP_G00007970 [Metynnis hypsauchen]